MKAERLFSLLLIGLFCVTSSGLNAQTSVANRQQSSQDAPLVDENEDTTDLLYTKDCNDSTEFEFFSSDSNPKKVDFLHYGCLPDYPLNSKDLKDIVNYLKQVIPVIQKMDKKEIEMMEIL